MIMNEEKVVWIINQYASHLEARHFELAKSFREYGFTTAIITSSFHHGKHSFMFDEGYHCEKRQENVYFVYVKSKPAYYDNGGKRVINMLSFCREVLRSSKRIVEDVGAPSYIIGSSAHPFVWEVAYKLSRKYKAKFIAEFRDIWPLSLIEIQGVSENHPFVKVLSIVEKRAYRRSDAIVGTMPYAYKHVSDELGFPRDKYHWIPNGINTERIDRLLAQDAHLAKDLEDYLSAHWCCVYVGSIVKSECLDLILDAWKLVKTDSLYFAIIGEGAEKQHLQERIDREKIERVRLFPAVLPDEVPIILKDSNCCIAALEYSNIGRFGLSKYKLNDYLYSGKPTIFACDSPNVVDDAGHFTVHSAEAADLADMIIRVSKFDKEKLQQLEQQGKTHIKSKYDFNVIAEKYVSLFHSL